MQREESPYPHDWLRLAERDMSRVGRLLSMEDPEAAGFFLQQAIEKFLKAYLLAHGWRLQRTHDLDALLNQALLHDGSLEPYRALCQRVTGFYMAERYPFTGDVGLSPKDVQEAMAAAEPLVERLREGIAN